MPNSDDLARQIFENARNYAAAQNMRFGNGAESYFHDHAKNAAEVLTEGPGPNEGKIRAMNVVFEKLIDEMIQESKRIPGYRRQNPGLIGERTLAGALRKLCPLFPFC